jgi:hypothetical protein
VLAGKGYFDDVAFPNEDTIGVDDFEEYLREAARRRQYLLSVAKDHHEVLKAIHEGDYQPWYDPMPETSARPPAGGVDPAAPALACPANG